MEEQRVFVCSSDVAAFVDALETFGYSSKAESENGLQSEAVLEFTVKNSLATQPDTVKEVPKRLRANPKQQKEVIEELFEKQKAVVTERSFMNLKGTKRFKSDVWSWFGDIKLLISSCEAKKLNIPFYIRHCGGEQMILSKTFVACFKCSALFIHDSQKSGTSTLRSHMKVCSQPKSKEKRHSPTIVFFSNTSSSSLKEVSVTDYERNNVQNTMLNFFLSSQTSFDAVKNKELQKLLQLCILIGSTYSDVNIDSMLCPQEKISSFLLHDTYVNGINQFYTELQYVHGASYFINIWQDENKQSYISLICYYASKSGEMKSVFLQSDEFPYRNKYPEDVKDWFLSLISNQPVVPLKRLFLTDTHSNMETVFGDEIFIKCVAQSLNSVIDNVFKGIINCEIANKAYLHLIKACFKLVTYLEEHSFKYRFPKHWNLLTYSWKDVVNCLKLIDKYFDSIQSFLNETGNINQLSFERQSVIEFVKFFQQFEMAIEELSVTTEPTMNIYVPWAVKLRKLCLTCGKDSQVIQYFKKELCFELNEIITKSVSIYHRIATLLDPRFKKLIFLPREDHIAASIKTKYLVKECIEAPSLEDFPETGIFKSEEKYKMLLSADELASEKNAQKEVDQYLSEPFQLVNEEIDYKLGKFNPLQYWVKNSNKYPHLSKVAMWILSCPASCINSEESFKDGNWFVNCYRIHLSTEHVNKALFVKSFMKL